MASHLPVAHFPLSSSMLPSTVPLHCHICAKKPTFSDVSHLLTHIASKGHLSTYYKIKVKAAQDDAAKQLIENYDTWYATWNIENLMSERMSLKDQKRRPRGQSSARMLYIDVISRVSRSSADCTQLVRAHELGPQFLLILRMPHLVRLILD